MAAFSFFTTFFLKRKEIAGILESQKLFFVGEKRDAYAFAQRYDRASCAWRGNVDSPAGERINAAMLQEVE